MDNIATIPVEAKATDQATTMLTGF